MMLTDGLRATGRYPTPRPERVAAISPLAQARKGTYTVPTFIVHGDADEIVPVGMSGELLVLPGKGRVFDMSCRPGRDGWETEVVPGYAFLMDVVGLR